MYTPDAFSMKDRQEMIALMRAYPFALLVSGREGELQSTHLPFVVEEKEGEVILSAHLSRANPQWQYLEHQSVMVVFSGPHAYISPILYAHAVNVPTWNYLTVHARGKARLVTDAHEVMDMLNALINTYEPGYQDAWKNLPADYVQGNRRGIMAVQIVVTQLEGVKKLSQNKSPAERLRIAQEMLQRTDSIQQSLGEYMLREIPKEKE